LLSLPQQLQALLQLLNYVDYARVRLPEAHITSGTTLMLLKNQMGMCISSASHLNAPIPGIIEECRVVDGWKVIGNVDDVIIIWNSPEMKKEFPELSQLAERVLNLHCTSCGVERVWSVEAA
jgi:hAT family C-terminal dimerisation region